MQATVRPMGQKGGWTLMCGLLPMGCKTCKVCFGPVSLLFGRDGRPGNKETKLGLMGCDGVARQGEGGG